MITVDIPRETALKILYEINEKGAYSNIALNRHLEGSRLKPVDRGFVTEMVYGTVKWRLSLDWAISCYSNVKLKKVSPWIINILRLGAYQLLYMDKVPASAACNESVKLARKYGHSGTVGYVNAVMRKLAEAADPSRIQLPDRLNPVRYLSVKYSHPEWMVSKFIGLFGEEFTEELLSANNKVPPLIARVNTLKTDKQGLVEELAAGGVTALPGRYCEDAVILENPSSITRIKAFTDGLFTIQDESSMLAVKVLDPKPGEVVMDVCSAPGGKATYIAQLMSNKGTVLARDIHPKKLELLEEAAQRLGIDIIKTEVFDAAVLDERYAGKADKVLLDAPCTGLGIIRKKPDIKWTKELEDETEITAIQYRLITNVSKYVRQGGVLVYSTCTITPAENTGIVERFLNSAEGREFLLEDISQYLPEQLAAKLPEKG
ncbi:MAG: 16S rRNA (cytosine(967)-C(5))-methyltransferase RsmB, partial [Clostridiales bacterium]|nr:16S rRNA (cytosine(967)-C(5))-methyltransferase RsmB [Clostridiales bacterium]